MNERTARFTLQQRFAECAKHEERIRAAKRNLAPLMPLSVDRFKTLNEEQAGFVDQLVYRFSKLQDTLGEKIFPALLLLGKEEIKGKTFLDILNRMEEFRILNAKDWGALREMRNEISHEYADDPTDVVNALNAVYEKSEELIGIFQRSREFAKKYGI